MSPRELYGASGNFGGVIRQRAIHFMSGFYSRSGDCNQDIATTSATTVNFSTFWKIARDYCKSAVQSKRSNLPKKLIPLRTCRYSGTASTRLYSGRCSHEESRGIVGYEGARVYMQMQVRMAHYSDGSSGRKKRERTYGGEGNAKNTKGKAG